MMSRSGYRDIICLHRHPDIKSAKRLSIIVSLVVVFRLFAFPPVTTVSNCAVSVQLTLSLSIYMSIWSERETAIAITPLSPFLSWRQPTTDWPTVRPLPYTKMSDYTHASQASNCHFFMSLSSCTCSNYSATGRLALHTHSVNTGDDSDKIRYPDFYRIFSSYFSHSISGCRQSLILTTLISSIFWCTCNVMSIASFTE